MDETRDMCKNINPRRVYLKCFENKSLLPKRITKNKRYQNQLNGRYSGTTLDQIAGVYTINND